MNSEQDTLIVAVDGGGSTCRVRIYRQSGDVLGEAQGQSANVNTNAVETQQNVQATIEAAYVDAALPTSRIPLDVVYLGLAGANASQNAASLGETLNFRQHCVVSDRLTTVAGALGEGDGAVAQLGTGSFFSVRQNGVLHEVGGWGFQLSDDCGGAYLGRKLLRAVVAAYDGLADRSKLTDEIIEKFGGTPRNLVAFVQSATPLDYGRLVLQLCAAQKNGDVVACRILEESVNKLVDVLDKLKVKSVGRLCLLGGVGPTYRRLLPPHYYDILVEPEGDALDGAFKLAKGDLLACAH